MFFQFANSFNKGKKEICCILVKPLIRSSNKVNIRKSVERVTINEFIMC